jgi:hypothetical protein
VETCLFLVVDSDACRPPADSSDLLLVTGA